MTIVIFWQGGIMFIVSIVVFEGGHKSPPGKGKSMNMTKQVKMMVESINRYFRDNKIKNESNDVFLVVSYALMQANVYKGFNWFNESGKTVKETDENAFIQFYTG